MTGSAYDGLEGLNAFCRDLKAWLDQNSGSLAARSEGAELVDEVARTRKNQAQLWDAGWLRYGWPPSVGGLGGSALLRAAVAEEIASRGLCYDSLFAIGEVLGPTVVESAPALAAQYMQPFLAGAEGWCQGFSEPDAGSDLASLRCRAVDDGDHWSITGQKIWSSYGQFADRMVLLARTGSPESRHRGITAMLVDMDWPGVTVRPLHGINDQDEFIETFFDSVSVSKDRVIGEVDGGWSVAMSILRSERGAIFWMQSAWMLSVLSGHMEEARLSDRDDERLGHVFASIAAVRARTWTTQHRMTSGSISTPATSIDKVLMATAEQELFDLVRSTSDGLFEFDDRPASREARSEYMYSRAASIYGGSAEIQRNIIADQLLGLRGVGDDRRS
jgi:alkylation response protein AidB-like acyl-CoA dehydrogenase